MVVTDEQLLHLSRYIHNQASYSQGQPLQKPYPSSYPNYLDKINQEWIKTDQILSFFSKSIQNLTYKTFVEGYKDFAEDGITKLILE